MEEATVAVEPEARADSECESKVGFAVAPTEATVVFSWTEGGASEGGTDCEAGTAADIVCVGVEGTCFGPEAGAGAAAEGGTGVAAGVGTEWVAASAGEVGLG